VLAIIPEFLSLNLKKEKSIRISGPRIRSLVQESQAPGVHAVVWDGNHQNGRKATPGLYVIRIETALKSTAVKVINN
jgi:flagellar hook assembly protein FlgD